MNKATKVLLAFLVLVPALFADDNHVYLNMKGNSGFTIKEVYQSSIDPGEALNLPITCDDAASPIGFASNDEATHDRTHTYLSQGKFSCIYLSDLWGQSPITVNSGRDDSETVANMLNDLTKTMDGGDAAIVLSNRNAFNDATDDCNNPIMAGGLPTQLNFFVLLKIEFQDANNNSVWCDNIVLAQQGNEPYQPKVMHQLLSGLSATIKLSDKIGEIVETEDTDPDMWVAAGSSFVKAVSGIFGGLTSLSMEHNPWWITQLYPEEETRLSFTLSGNRGAYGPGADLSIGQDRTALMCSGENSEKYLLMVTEDTNSYENFSVELVPYGFISDEN